MNRDIFHLISHIVVYSCIVWQVIIGLWLIVRWCSKNIKLNFEKNTDKPIIINTEAKAYDGDTTTSDKNKNLKAIEVDIEKNIFIDKKTNKSDKLVDETIKGKVKTQKDKLKKLRGN